MQNQKPQSLHPVAGKTDADELKELALEVGMTVAVSFPASIGVNFRMCAKNRNGPSGVCVFDIDFTTNEARTAAQVLIENGGVPILRGWRTALMPVPNSSARRLTVTQVVA